jgi:uncharacterized protein (DUF2249 family)
MEDATMTQPTAAAPGSGPIPATLAAIPEGRRVHLDVRDEIRRGEEPLARIMSAVRALAAEQVLVLRAPFEPLPLYKVLAGRGFAHWTECRAPDDWVVWFYREERAAGSPTPATGEMAAAKASEAAIRLDVRGLEPPEPMVQVLAQLDALGPGQTLEVLHDRRPVFLYPQLDDRGFSHETDEPAPGLVRIVIRRGRL